MTNTKDSGKKLIKPEEKAQIFKAFMVLEKRRNESIPLDVQKQWIEDLTNSEYSVRQIVEKITNAGLRTDIYGKVKLTDILESGDSILDMDLVTIKVIEKLNQILEFKNYSLEKFQLEYKEHLQGEYDKKYLPE